MDRNITCDLVSSGGMFPNNVGRSSGCAVFSQNRVAVGMKLHSSWEVVCERETFDMQRCPKQDKEARKE